MLSNYSGLLNQGVRLISGFLVTPIIIKTLGAEMYGAWAIINQLMSYFALSDLRSGGTLKSLIMVRQHETDFGKKRQLIGAASLIWTGSTIVLILIASVIVPSLPRFLKVSPENHVSIQIATIVLFVGLVLTQGFSIAGCVVRGMNLDYKSLGLRTVVAFIVPLLGLLTVLNGGGIIGLATASTIGSLMLGFMWYYIVRKFVPWYGISRPTRLDCVKFTQQSAWNLGVSAGLAVLTTSDVFLVGVLFDVKTAGSFVMNGLIVRMALLPVTNLISSSWAGIGGLCGAGEWYRATNAVKNLTIVSAAAMAIISSIVLVVNENILNKLFGPDFYMGPMLTVLLAIQTATQAFNATVGTVADGVLAFRARATSILAGAGVSLILVVATSSALGLQALPLSFITGNLISCFLVGKYVERVSGVRFALARRGVARVFVLAAPFFIVVYQFSFGDDGWFHLSFKVAIVSLLISYALFKWGIDSPLQKIIIAGARTQLTRVLLLSKKLS